MKQDEAEKLARELRPPDDRYFVPVGTADDLRALCDHVLSGSMKREIENAAYQRANSLVLKQCGTEGDHADNALCAASDAITALIQPPAQKEGGK